MDRDIAAVQTQVLTPEQLEAIRRYDTCTIANAIECFGIRLRNEGFTRTGLTPVTDPNERILGYAATFRVRSSNPPVTGGQYVDRTDWWDAVERLPRPMVAVFASANDDSGAGACIGEVHGAILQAFGCNGVITDGSVRDVSGLRKLGLPVFATSLAVSHAFMHIVDFGTPVEILGLTVRPGDLLFADCHGVLSIPAGIAAELPEVAERICQEDRAVIEVCQSPDFSREKLLAALREHRQCR